MSATHNSRAPSREMSWTVLSAGLFVVVFGCIIIVFGGPAQRDFVKPVFGLGGSFVAVAMGIRSLGHFVI